MKAFKNWLPAILIALAIFLLSSLTGDSVAKTGLGHEPYQINAHFFLYFLLTFALFKATKDVGFAMAISIFYSLTDEFHQMFVPGRDFQFFDILVDSLGTIIAGIILWKYYYRLPKKLAIWLEK